MSQTLEPAEQQGGEPRAIESTEPEVSATQASSSESLEPHVPEPTEPQTYELEVIESTEPEVSKPQEPQSEAQPTESETVEQPSEAETDIVGAVAQAPPQNAAAGNEPAYSDHTNLWTHHN